MSYHTNILIANSITATYHVHMKKNLCGTFHNKPHDYMSQAEQDIKYKT